MNKYNLPIFNATAWRDDEHCCLVAVSQGCILRASAITCAWEGDPRFDAWFRANYPIIEIRCDRGRGFYKLLGQRRVRPLEPISR